MLDRNRELARRCGDLSPLAGAVRDRLLEGNRAVILAGVSPGTTRLVAPLRPWAGPPPTYPKRKGSGPPRAPMGAASRIVSGCEIAVRAGVGQLSFTKSYPSLGPIAEFLDSGTPRMAARPFFEFRRIDLEWVGARLREHVVQPGVFARIAGFFGR